MNKISISESLSLPTSSSSSSSSTFHSRDSSAKAQRYVVKMSTTTCQTQSLAQSRVFQLLTSNFSNEIANAKHQEALSSREASLESIPKPDDLDDKGTRFKWYNDWITRKDVLEELLVMARTHSKDKPITQRDLNNILESCQNYNEGILASRSECQYLAFRILHYIAEHRLQLSEVAIDTLMIQLHHDTMTDECSKSERKRLPYVTMALAYAIYHDPWLTLAGDLPVVLDAAIHKLWRANNKKCFEVVMIALAAKAKLKIPLTDEDLLKIKQALAEVTDPEVDSLYFSHSVRVKTSKKRHFLAYKTSKTFRTKENFLSKIKRHVKSGKLLSEHRMKDILNCYESTKHTETKQKILHIIQLIIFNHQRLFSTLTQKTLERVLKLALKDFEFKLRSRALMIANVFMMNGELPAIRNALNAARVRQRLYALSALDHHFNLVERTRLASDKTLSRLLTNLLKDNHEKIRYQARYILFKFNNDTTHLSSLLLQPEKSVTVSATCLELAKNSQQISIDILRVMTALILNYQKNYSTEAVYNVIAAFRYTVENKQEIDPKIIEEAINLVTDPTSDFRLKKAALSLLIAGVNVYPGIVMCHRLLTALDNFLRSQKFISESCLLLCRWISLSSEFRGMYDLFFDILHLLTINLSLNKVNHLTRVLGQAAEKNYPFSQVFVDKLILIARRNDNISHQYRFVQVLAAALRSKTWMWWSQEFYELLLNLCLLAEKPYFLDGGALLCKYLEILNVPLFPVCQRQLIPLFSIEKTKGLGFEIYEIVVSKKNEIDHLILNVFVDIFLKRQSDISYRTVNLLEGISTYQVFPRKVIAKVILGLSISDEQFIPTIVTILERNISVLVNDFQTVGRNSIEPLMAIAEDVNKQCSTRLRALSILKSISERSSQVFPFSDIDKLIHLLKDPHEEIQVEAIKLLSSQIPQLEYSIVIQNAFIVKIERGVLPCLHNDMLQRYALHILCSMGLLGYALSRNTLENIVNTLYEETEIEIFRLIFNLLEENQTRLTPMIRNVLSMQRATYSIEAGRDREVAITELINLVQERVPMIHRVFQVLVNLMNDNHGIFIQNTEYSASLFGLILNFCEIVLDNEHVVPSKLVQSICRLDIPRETSGYTQRSLWVARCLTKNNAVDPIAYSVIEKGFLTDYFYEHTLLYLEALDDAVKNGFTLHMQAVDRLWKILIYLDNEKESLNSVEILLIIFSLDNIDILQGDNHIEELLAFIEKTSSSRLKKKLHLLLSRLTHLTIMKDNQLEVIYQAILSTDDFQQQHAFCALLKTQINKVKLSPQHVDMICFKQTEYLFIQEGKTYSQSTSFHHLGNLLEIIAIGQHQLSFDFFSVIENLIQTLHSPESSQILGYIECIAARQQIPSFILESILGVINKQFEKIFSIFHRCVERKQQFSEEIINVLTVILLKSAKVELRIRAYQLLVRIIQYQTVPNELEFLLDIECIDGKLKSVQEVYSHVKMGRELSLNNAEALLILLQLGQQRKKILSIFDEVKPQIPRSFQKRIFLAYQELYLLDEQNHSFYLQFFQHALITETVEISQSVALLENVHSKLMERKEITKEEVTLLYSLLPVSNFQLDETVLIKIISLYFKTDDSLLRRECVYLLLAQFDTLPIWSSTLLNQLRRLMEKVYPNEENENDTPSTSSSQPFSFSRFFSSLISVFTDNDESNEKPIQTVDIETLSNLLLFVLEDPRSGNHFSAFEERLVVSETALKEQFIEQTRGSDNSPEDVAFFNLLLTELRALNRGKSLCRQLRLLMSKQQEYAMDLLGVNEFLSNILCMPERIESLFRLGPIRCREHFLETLFTSFEAFRESPSQQKETVYSTYKALNWQPQQGKNYLSKLHRSSNVDDLLALLILIRDYSINPLFIEEKLTSFTIGECLVSTLDRSIKLHLLNDTLYSLSERECFTQNIVVGPDLLSRWLEHAIVNALELCKQGWNFSSLIEWLEHMNASTAKHLSIDIRNLSDLLSMAVNYQEQISEERFYRMIEREMQREQIITPEVLHAFIVERHLTSLNKGKELTSLLEEIESILSTKQSFNFVKHVDTKRIVAIIKEVETLYTSPVSRESSSLRNDPALSTAIGKWSKNDIQKWALSNKKRAALTECLAVCKQACLLVYGYEPKIAQLVAISILAGGTKPGIIAQVHTGEGKSLIIAILSVIKALEGSTVDVITSSPVLAKRDVKYLQPFYECFNLKAASNEDHHYETGLKACYAKDISIVYGEPGQYQFDALRDQYSRLGTRGARDFDVVIIDESDNVLVEGIDTLAMLANPMPAMQELTPLLMCIWIELNNLDKLLKNPEAVLVNRENPFSRINRDNRESTMEKIEELLLTYVHRILDESKGWIQLPHHLREFALSQAKEWIHSAWLALYIYRPDHHYVIKKNHEGVKCIAPVDFSNTGGVQIGTSWGEGLQQFLQIKHSLSVDQLTLVTNYSSIHSYISQYTEKVGLTGTLGSPGIQQLMYELYGCKSVEIPTYLSGNRLKLSPKLLKNKQSWLEYIVFNAVREAEFKRVVLIICETIETANEVEAYLERVYKGGGVLTYVDDKIESTNIFEKEHGPNTVIIATNLAGRGTDIRISKEVVQHGGLHVCVTFLPANSRVGHQAFGRGSRRGEPGSVQLVLNQEDLRHQLPSATDQQIEELNQKPHLVEVLRDNEESSKLELMKRTTLPDLFLQDKLFKLYLLLLEEVRDIDESKQKKSVIEKGQELFSPKFIYQIELRRMKELALEEEWGRWLRNVQSLPNKREAIAQFQLFRERMLTAYRGETLIQNPIYYIRLGNQMLDQANSLRNLLSKSALLRYAIGAYDRAIEKDRMFSHNAYYHQAYAMIQLKRRGYKEKAKGLLKQMQEVLMNGPFKHLQTASLLFNDYRSKSINHTSNALCEQIQQQLQVYQLMLDCAKEAILQIEESQKLIQFQTGAPCYSSLYREKSTKEVILEQLDCQPPSTSINLTFYHLKTHQDLNECSQLRDTIKALPKKAKITLSYDSGKLYSNNGKKYGLRKFLPINRYRLGGKQTGQPSTSSSSHPPESSSSVDVASRVKTPIGIKENIGEAFKTLGKAKKATVQKLKKGKDYYDQKTERLNDWMHSYAVMDNTPVTLTLKNQTSASIKEAISHFEFTSNQLFGIGPIVITPALLDVLRCRFPTLQVTIWVPPVTNQVIKSPIPHEPTIVGIKDSLLESLGAEISIIKCSKKSLFPILSLLDNPALAFTLVLHGLDQKLANEFMSRTLHPMILEFVGLTKKEALKIINLTPGEHNQAILTIQQIDPPIAAEIIKNANRSREALAIKHRSPKTEFAKICDIPSFLAHHQLNGYGYLFDVKELLPMPYKSLALLSALSMAEIGGGIALTVCTAGLGASIGQGLISEGILDIIRTFSTVCSRQFDVSDFVLQKSISLAFLLMTAGFSSINDAKNAAQSAKSTIQALKSTHTSQSAINTTRHCMVELGKTGAKVGLKKTLNVASQKFLSSQNKSSKHRMQKDVENMFNKESWNQTLNLIFGIHAFLYGSCELSKNQELSLLVERARGLIYNDKYSKSHLSVIKGRVLAHFEPQFDDILNQRETDSKDIYQIFEKKLLGIKKEELRTICQWLKENGVIHSNGQVDFIQLDQYRQAKSKSVMRSSPIPEHDPARYDVNAYNLKTFTCSKNMERRHEVLSCCLTYARFLRDDYFEERQQLVREISEIFQIQFIESVQVGTETVKSLSYVAGSQLISYIGDTVESNMSRPTKGNTDAKQSTSGKAPGHSHSHSLHARDNLTTISKDVGISPPIRIPRDQFNQVSSSTSIPGRIQTHKHFGGAIRAKQELLKNGGAHIAKGRTLGQFGQIAKNSKPGRLLAASTSFLKSGMIQKVLLPIGTVTFKTLHVGYIAEYRRGIALREERITHLMGQQAFSSAEKLSTSYRNGMRDELRLIKSLIGLLLIEGESLNASEIACDDREREGFEARVDKAFSECYYTLNGQTTAKLKAIGANSTNPAIQECLKKLDDAWEQYKSLVKKESELGSSILQSLRLARGVNVYKDVLALSRKEDYSAMGIKMTQGGLSELSCIGGFVIHELGDLMDDFIESKTISKLSRARIKCLTITLVGRLISGQQMLMKEVIQTHKISVEVHELTLSCIERYYQEYRQEIRKEARKAFQFILNANNELQMTKGMNTFKEQQGIRLKILKTRGRQIKEWAKLNDLDPEMINRYSEQTNAIIFEMNAIVSELCQHDLKYIEDKMAEIEREQLELRESRQISSTSSSSYSSTSSSTFKDD